MNEYKITENGTYYDQNTPDRVIDLLETARYRGYRVRLDYGDKETGKSWNEIYDTTGTLSRSTGPYKIPILIKTIRSIGGPGILTNCIIKIDWKPKGSRKYYNVYKHPNYHK